MQLMAAVGGLWLALSGLAAAVVRWLVQDREAMERAWRDRLAAEQAECAGRVAALEGKLDAAGETIRRQTEALQRQVDTQQELLAQQARLIEALRAPRSGGSAP